MRIDRSPRALACAFALSAIACADGPAAERARAAVDSVAPTRRHFEVVAETLWTRGGSEHDTLVSFFRAMRVSGGRLHVVDAATGASIVLESRTGRTLPGERGFATDLATRQRCRAESSGTWHLESSESYPLALRASDSTVRRRLPWPWPGLALESSLRRQAWLIPGRRDGECIVALMLGIGFARLVDGEVVYRRPYVDAFELPEVAISIDTAGDSVTRREKLLRRRVAAAAIARVGELLAVAGDGTRGPAEGSIDLYHIDDGVYAGTWRFASTVSALAGDDSTLFVGHTRAGRPSITALHLRLGRAP